MIGSVQDKLNRIRKPRVHIVYDVETEGGTIQKELPCVIGLIADLTGLRDQSITPYAERKFVFLDPDNFNQVLKSYKPRVDVPIQSQDEKLLASIIFSSIDDFGPTQVIKAVPQLKALYEKRIGFSDLQTRISNSSSLYEKALVILKNKQDSSIVFADYQFTDDTQKTYFLQIFNLLSDLSGPNSSDQDPLLAIQKQLIDLDTVISKCVDTILHDKSFQRLEGTWKGLLSLLKAMEIGERQKLRILNATKEEVDSDLSKALEFDQSILFKKIYEEEYGTYGGNPYTCLLVDWFITKNDSALLLKLSGVVACAHVPTVIGVSPDMFDIDSYEKLHLHRDLSKIFESPLAIPFRSFRESEDSRYVGLVLPRIMGRLPYGNKLCPVENIPYEEDTSDHDKFLWSNAIYYYGQLIARSFNQYNWFASIVGPETGGMINYLPMVPLKTSDGDIVPKPPTETTITERRERELSNQGFMAVCYKKDSDCAVFFSSQTSNKPAKYDKPEANANSQISSRFQYVLNASRFAHYLKCIMRDKIGGFATKDSIESYLNNWISQYVVLNSTSDQEIKTKYPLSGASVTVSEDPSRPGTFTAIVLIQPHLQMEELTISLRLVARIPKK